MDEQHEDAAAEAAARETLSAAYAVDEDASEDEAVEAALADAGIEDVPEDEDEDAAADAVASETLATGDVNEPDYEVDDDVLRQERVAMLEVGKQVHIHLQDLAKSIVRVRKAITRMGTGVADWAGKSQAFIRWNEKTFAEMFPPLSDEAAEAKLADTFYAYSKTTKKSREVYGPEAIVLRTEVPGPEKMADWDDAAWQEAARTGLEDVLYLTGDKKEHGAFLANLKEHGGLDEAGLVRWDDAQDALRDHNERVRQLLASLGSQRKVWDPASKSMKMRHVDPKDVQVLIFGDLPESSREDHLTRLQAEELDERESTKRAANNRALRIIRETVSPRELALSGLKPEAVGGEKETRGSRKTADTTVVDATHTAVVTAIMDESFPLHEKLSAISEAMAKLVAKGVPETFSGGEKRQAKVVLATIVLNAQKLAAEMDEESIPTEATEADTEATEAA